jgi:SAM-dependent methyltransferase
MEEDLSQLPASHIHYPIQQLSWYNQGDNSEKHALDLACGDGKVACYLAMKGYNVTAIDALPSAIEITEKRAEALGIKDKVTLILGDIDSFALNQKYDVIIALQCLQYLFERVIPRFKELQEAVADNGFFVYSGNILPHFETDPPMRFIVEKDLRNLLTNWKVFSLGQEERILRENDKRGYIWTVSQKLVE